MPLITTAKIRSWGYYAVATENELLGHVRGDYKVGFSGLLLDGTRVGDFTTPDEAGAAVAARVFVDSLQSVTVAAV